MFVGETHGKLDWSVLNIKWTPISNINILSSESRVLKDQNVTLDSLVVEEEVFDQLARTKPTDPWTAETFQQSIMSDSTSGAGQENLQIADSTHLASEEGSREAETPITPQGGRRSRAPTPTGSGGRATSGSGPRFTRSRLRVPNLRSLRDSVSPVQDERVVQRGGATMLVPAGHGPSTSGTSSRDPQDAQDKGKRKVGEVVSLDSDDGDDVKRRKAQEEAGLEVARELQEDE